jgi:macrolide transport system ATP-binding/permease protein
MKGEYRMPLQTISFHRVSFSYESSRAPLFQDISFTLSPGWTGVTGFNGAGKTTLLSLATEILVPQSGTIVGPRNRLYCEQGTDKCPSLLQSFLWSSDKDAWRIKTELGVEDEWPQRWETLSHGERKKSQTAQALWMAPDVLAIDEPTNHLDYSTKRILTAALLHFRGIGLIVSHDRELLDTLCHHCLFPDPPAVVLRHGGFSKGLEQKKMEEE